MREREQSSGDGKRYTVRVVRNARIPLAPANFSLAADLYLPVDAPPRPAVVMIGPYAKDGVAGSSGWYLNHYFASRGFPAILVDVQGSGSSSGPVRPPFSAEEAADGVAAVEWAARQDWCNGTVGMWGGSYSAILAMRTAALRPAPLKALFLIEGAANPGSGFVHPSGVRGCMSSLGMWPLGDLTLQLLPPLHFDRNGHWERIWQRRLEEARPRLFDFLHHGPDDPAWSSRRIDPSQIEVPSFCVGGWRDFLCAESIEAYQRIRAPKKLLMGPWTHLLPDQSPVVPVDLMAIAVRWWNRWLLNERNGVDHEPEVTAYVQGANRWRTFPCWPPGGESKRFIACADETLFEDSTVPAPSSTGMLTRPVDATVGARDGLWGFPMAGLPLDARDDDLQSISFTTRPLRHTIEIAGRPEAAISLGPETDGVSSFVVKLSEVDTAGRSRLICGGTVAIPAGEPAGRSFRVALADTSYQVAAGRCLRLTVSAADFPRLWPASLAKALSVEFAPGSADATWLRLPLVSPGTVADAIDLPAHPPGENLAPLGISLMPEWSVTEDLVASSLTLTLGAVSAMYTPQQEAVLEIANRVRATVSRACPDQATVHGSAKARVRRASGGEILVEVDLRVTGESATASGTVTIDGAPFFHRQWKAGDPA